jgi:hypothetical protein
MKAVAIVIGILVLTGALVWVMYPTSIPARQDVYRPLSASEFRAIRSLAIEIERSGVGPGVELNAGDEASNSLEFSCKGVPLVVLINSEQALVVMEFAGFEARAPGLGDTVGVLSRSLVRMQAADTQEIPAEPTGFESFLLKYRDGLDLTADCAR